MPIALQYFLAHQIFILHLKAIFYPYNMQIFLGRLRALRLLPTTSNFSIFEPYGFCFLVWLI
jgi:hypothetical protein